MKIIGAVFLSAFFVASSWATTLVETSDAGNTIPTAIVVGDEVTQIEGVLEADHDLWGFSIGASQSVQILLWNSPFDENLLLFDSQGRGLAGNDDIGRGTASPGIDLPPGVSGLDSEIVTFLDPGTYYVGVGANNSSGFTSADVSFISNDSGLLQTPTTDVLGYVGGSLGNGEYTLAINRIVPEPASTSAMALFAMVVVGTYRRRLRGGNCSR